MKTLITAFLLLAICTLAIADTITLKNGDVIHGKVVQSDQETTIVETDHGKIEIATATIASIEYSDQDSANVDKSKARNSGLRFDIDFSAPIYFGEQSSSGGSFGGPAPSFIPIPSVRLAYQFGGGLIDGGIGARAFILIAVNVLSLNPLPLIRLTTGA